MLRPLKSKHAEVIAENLVNIFCHFGSPVLLHSDNGREFVNQIIHALLKLWPECKMINGKARHSQSQGSVERCNRDIESMLACWQRDNNTTRWAYGLQFVQYAKNARYHKGIGRSPFMAQMGHEAQLGVQTLNLDKDILEGVDTEEQLNEILPNNEVEDENSSDLNKSFNNNEVEDAEFVLLQEEDNSEHEIDSVNIEPAIVTTEIVDSVPVQIDACINCSKNFMPATFSKAKTCLQCQRFCHDFCLSSENVCRLCEKGTEMINQRNGAKRKQQEQADRKLEKSVERFKPADIGETVLVPIPDLDRGRCEYPNLKAIVLENHENGHLWRLGCRSGVLDQWYSRNQFQPTIEKFITADEVPLGIEISLRAAAKAESIGGGQGYLRCNCTGNCKTKRCKCFKENLKCNSRCHNQRSCSNKD